MAETTLKREEAVQTYRRFSVPQRLEHLVLIVSFTTLAVTGLPQIVAGTTWGETLIGVLGGIERVRVIHRLAAILLMLQAIYHIVTVGYRIVVLWARLSMLPRLQDARDLIQCIRYNLGRAKERPRFDRFSYEHKMEYWAVVWGTVIMIITGFMLWNPIATTRFLPGQFIPAAKAAHGAEAVLAVLAIVTWHLYGAHLRRFNRSIFTGRLSEEEMQEEHPLELARIEAGEPEPQPSPAAKRRRERLYLAAAAVLSVTLLGGLYLFVTFEETAIATVPRRTEVPAFLPATPTIGAAMKRPTPTPTQPAAREPSFASEILPIFESRCGACHGAMGGLSLSDYDSVLEGGSSGPVLVAGDPEASLLVQVQEGEHPAVVSPEELALIQAWIEAGALDN